MNVRPRRRPGLWALLIILLLAGPLPAAPVAEAAPACTASPFWTCRFLLDGIRPTNVTSEGLSLFMIEPKSARIAQLRFNADGSFSQIGLPWVLPPSSPLKPELGTLVLGPRAFYAIVTFPDPAIGVDATIPYLFRADRIPTAMAGGWRLLRQTAGPADYLSSVVMNRTVWMLRSCGQDCLDARKKGSNAAFAVDWQPLATENSQILQPPGPTIDLGDAVKARPAAGVTATQDAIYVFGGQDTPTSATRIPLKNGTPGTPVQMRDLDRDRVGATALVHGTSVYLVGGNNPSDPADPAIVRGKIEQRTDSRTGAVIGNIQKWEPLPPPKLDGATITTAVFARGQLWIIRSDGWIQTMDVGAVAPGQTRLTWADASAQISHGLPGGGFDAPLPWQPIVPPQPIKVRHGDKIDLTLDWSYTGAQTFDGVTVEVVGQPSDPGQRKPPSSSFVRIDDGTDNGALRKDYDLGLLPPTTEGQQIKLRAVIPNDVYDPIKKKRVADRRTEYNATVQLVAGGQRLGPIQRLRFVIERPRLR
ncbi:MAG TPA: hypothetical protein VGL23_22810 [Chloroflexota bacterium]